MKAKFTNLFTVLILVLIVSNSYSQSISDKTYSNTEIVLTYSEDNAELKDNSKTSFRIKEMDKVTEIKFLSDSIINASSIYTSKSKDIPVRNLNSIKVVTGNKYWLGAGIGAGVGTLIGFLIGNSLYNSAVEEDNTGGVVSGIFVSPAKVLFPVLGFIAGGLIGGGIGSSFDTYNIFDFTKSENKQDQLRKVLRSNGNSNF